MGFATLSVGMFFVGHLAILLLSRTTKEAIQGQNTPPLRCANSCDEIGVICCSPFRKRYGYDTVCAGTYRVVSSELANARYRDGGTGRGVAVEMAVGMWRGMQEREAPVRDRASDVAAADVLNGFRRETKSSAIAV